MKKLFIICILGSGIPTACRKTTEAHQWIGETGKTVVSKWTGSKCDKYLAKIVKM